MSSIDAAGIESASAGEGTGYGYGPQRHSAVLTEIGPRTPCSEYLRRYWHPVVVSAEVGGRPKKVKVLGEELIIFRDGKGRSDLLRPRCAP